MPELPEVETTKRGIAPHILNQQITGVTLRNGSLRWPVPANLAAIVSGQTVIEIQRRGKYLLVRCENGHLLIHLGMSGSLRVINDQRPPATHDHLDITFKHCLLRYNDPRRFGAVLWHQGDISEHPLLAHLGPEPLTDNFSGDYLYQRSRKRTQAIKTWIMDSRLVVGVGNIYANEALFAAEIHPLKAAHKVSRAKCEALAKAIKKVLAHAIERGGTTLRDFVGSDGKPGYFAQELNVYGRSGQPCPRCAKALTEKRLGQRTTVYCTKCQK